MAAKKVNFTDNLLKRIKASPDKARSYIYDAKTPGLRLQVTANGTKSFQYQFWSSKHRRPITRTLGRYPALSIREARKQATACMKELNDGVDLEREASLIRKEDDLDAVFDGWLSNHAVRHKATWKDDLNRYNRYIRKPLGNKRMSWFTTDKVRSWHQKITTMPKRRGVGTVSPTTANRALALLRAVFSQACPHIPNPCVGVKEFKEVSRNRFLQPNELKSFFVELFAPETPGNFRDYILLSLFTGARRSNILSMRWDELILEERIWTIPASKSKNGSEMTVHLGTAALLILSRRKKDSSSEFVFPGQGATGHYTEPKRAWQSLLKRANLEGLRLHDLRRTFGSYITMSGAPTAIVGMMLGHKDPKSTEVYARMHDDAAKAITDKGIEKMLKSAGITSLEDFLP